MHSLVLDDYAISIKSRHIFWVVGLTQTLPRTSQKNGKGHQNGYGQMPHRGSLTENVGDE